MYVAVVLLVLLYGCEAWALKISLLTKLRSIHNRCVRAIAGVNMWKVREFRITCEEGAEEGGFEDHRGVHSQKAFEMDWPCE